MRRKLRQDVSEIKQLVSSINSALIVREPGTALAAEAYEGLRRQVAQATAERRAHLTQLVRILEALDSGVSAESLQSLVEQWADQAGLRRWHEPDPAEYFDIIGNGDGSLEVLQPAWVGGEPAALIKPGLLKRHDSSAAKETQEPADDAHETLPKEDT